jgi:chromosome segregation ATPase
MIKGVILQNFMSYENADIRLKDGLNIICGPNGAGKSSILLAISIILGQTYTERSRRLSDLIRWGADQARITLQIENRTKEGKKLFPYYRSNVIEITRIIKKNGGYSYLIQNRTVSKDTVISAFKKLGINPDNMLLIMHQLMVIKFSSVSPQDKLRLLEEAIGFQSYRQFILEAYDRLNKAVNEEKSLTSMIESTKETYDFWKKEHEKYLKKQELEKKLAELKRESLWTNVENKESALFQLEGRMVAQGKKFGKLEERSVKALSLCKEKESSFEKIRQAAKKLEEEKLNIVKDATSYNVGITWARKFLDEMKNFVLDLEKEIETRPELKGILEVYKEKFENRENETNSLLREFEKELKGMGGREESIKKQSIVMEKNYDNTLSEIIDSKINTEMLNFKKSSLSEELQELETKLKVLKKELEPILIEAKKSGPRIVNLRKTVDIDKETAIIKGQLIPLSSISQNVEKMFESHSSLYKELKEKAEIVAENRKITMIELKKRLDFWRDEIVKFLSELTIAFNNISAEVGATGTIKLVNEKEINEAGLDLQVGFSGRKPVSLDSLAQSGGERSVALMAFLLALQQHIASPFRAIDEFDVHMDPRNREIISRLIVNSAKSMKSGQYVAITPGQITMMDKDINVIVVQNIDGSSLVSELK